VPGQHQDHRSEINPLGDPGDISEILQRIRHHRVGRKVMLDSPDRIETGFIGDARNIDFFLP
jgi:hypothetical protein